MDSDSQLQPPPDSFLAPLLELRDYYAPLVEKYENLYTQALKNLNHVEGLLSNWSSNSDTQDKLAKDEANSEVIVAPNLENFSSSNSDNILETQLKLIESVNSQLPETNNLETENSFSASEKVDVLPVETASETQENSLLWSEIPMVSEYQSLNRSEAIQKILQKHAGDICHIDLIVRSLYGELESDVFKVVKGRVQSSLTYGRESGKWFAIPGKPGCFTLDLKLLNSNGDRSSTQQGKNKNKKPSPVAKTNLIPMLREFEGQFLIDALTSFFQKNPGKIFNVTEIINKLYGELEAHEFREVKPKVLNELSRGHRTGKFSRVPEEIGLYTWDSKLLQQTKSK